MLATLTPDLQKPYEHVDAYTMIQGLRGMFERTYQGPRDIISQNPCLHARWQRVARSVLM
jgi:hypothetical protein